MVRTLTAAAALTLACSCLNSDASPTATSPTPAPQDQPAAAAKPVVKPRMDVVFTIDATGSMADEIDVIKKEVWAIANNLVTGEPPPDIRFGLVLYRDTTDEQLVEVTALTRDVDAIHKKLMAANADGGGDKPEHVGKGLHASLDLQWDLDPAVERTIYLVGDAGANPHPEFTVATAVLRAKEMNVSINTIGCSGLTLSERNEFTELASQVGGKFEALTYYAVVDQGDGTKKSVIYYDGDAWETDGEISDEDWMKGGKEVIESRKMTKATSATKSSARSAPTKNNLDSVVRKDMKRRAKKKGVTYK